MAFEKLMDAWSTSSTHQQLLGFTQMLLAYSMTVGYHCAFAQSRDRLDDLLALVQPTVVVTLNYDTLIEEALRRKGLRFTYPHLPGPRATGLDEGDFISEGDGDVVPVFKLHGSINWLPESGGAVGADFAIVDEIAQARRTTLLRTGPLVSSQGWATYVPPNRSILLFELESHSDYAPVAAVYGTGKYLLRNPHHVESHRNACFDRLHSGKTASVAAVGIRPVSKEDDPFVSRLLDYLGAATGKKVYVSPSPDDGHAFHGKGFRSFTGTLADFLANYPWSEATRGPVPT